MTLLDYLKSNWEGVPIYFNTIKFDDYFINIVPFMLGNKVIKYDEDKNYNNGGDLFITDNTLLIKKAKKDGVHSSLPFCHQKLSELGTVSEHAIKETGRGKRQSKDHIEREENLLWKG